MLSELKNTKLSQDNLVKYTIIISGLFCLVLLIYHFLLDNFAPPGQYTSSLPEWNADRLMMAFFWKYKFNLYNPQDNVGPLISDMYGPFLALAYLPATIANSPTFALVLGKILSLGYYFIPVIWLYISETWQQKKLSLSILALIAFFFFTTEYRTLFYDAFRICADCPALGFSALACVIIYREQGKQEIPIIKLLISAILAVIAVWSKQIAVPILIALPLYIFLAWDIKIFWRYLVCLLVSGTIISTILLVAFNPEALLFNVITIPGHHPWIGDAEKVEALLSGVIQENIDPWINGSNTILALLSIAKELTKSCLFPGTIVLFSILLTPPKDFTTFKTWIQDNPWLLFFIASLCFIPTSLLGEIKIGGDENGFYTVYFLTITAILILLRLASKVSTESEQGLFQRAGQTGLLAIVIMFTIHNVNLPIPYIYQAIPNFSHNVHQVVYEYSQKNPGKVYFPWHPFSVLMAENKLYHIDSGPLDRYLSGFPISKEDFLAYLPENFTMIAVPTWAKERGEQGQFYLHYLPEFNHKIEVPELSGFDVYVKESEE